MSEVWIWNEFDADLALTFFGSWFYDQNIANWIFISEVSERSRRRRRESQAIETENHMDQRLLKSVRVVIELLVTGRYADVESLTNGVRLSAQEMATAVSEYGRKLVMPPEDAFELMDVVEVTNSQPPRFSIAMPLWTVEEGRSDLSLELTVISDNKSNVIELDNIHVL